MYICVSGDLRSAALNLQRKYNSDLEEDFVEEVVQFREFVQDEKMSGTSAVELLKCLRRRKLHTVFPNTDIALWLFLAMPVTNASGERSFSKLGLVKNRLRSTMQQERVSHLTLMSIEHDIQMIWKLAFKYKKNFSFGNIIYYLELDIFDFSYVEKNAVQ